MTKQEFTGQYIEKAAEKAMAKVLLPDQELSLEEWRQLWARTLQSPAN